MSKNIKQILENWELVDNSGDGGPFGFHMKPVGKMVFLLSSSGEPGNNLDVAGDFTYPITIFPDDPETLPAMLSLFYSKEGQPALPTTGDEWMEQDSLSIYDHHDMVFENAEKATAFVAFIAEWEGSRKC